jgi:hypothetical protein
MPHRELLTESQRLAEVDQWTSLGDRFLHLLFCSFMTIGVAKSESPASIRSRIQGAFFGTHPLAVEASHTFQRSESPSPETPPGDNVTFAMGHHHFDRPLLREL